MAERQLPKLNVAGSIPVSRSSKLKDPFIGCAPLNLPGVLLPIYRCPAVLSRVATGVSILAHMGVVTG